MLSIEIVDTDFFLFLVPFLACHKLYKNLNIYNFKTSKLQHLKFFGIPEILDQSNFNKMCLLTYSTPNQVKKSVKSYHKKRLKKKKLRCNSSY